MPLINLGVEIADRGAIKGFGRKWGAIQRETLKAVAERWHSRILAKHFTPGNETRYGFDPRNPVYLRFIKPKTGQGQGRFVQLLSKGQSLRFLRNFARITATQRRATLRMTAPSYFTNPFIGTFYDPKAKRTKTVRRQPNKPKEATTISQADRQDLVTFLERELQRRLRELRK